MIDIWMKPGGWKYDLTWLLILLWKVSTASGCPKNPLLFHVYTPLTRVCVSYTHWLKPCTVCAEREKKKEKMLMIDEWYSGRCNNNGAVRLLLQKMATKTRFACCVLGIIFGHALLSVCIWLFSTSNKSKEEEFQVKAHKRPADLKV